MNNAKRLRPKTIVWASAIAILTIAAIIIAPAAFQPAPPAAMPMPTHTPVEHVDIPDTTPPVLPDIVIDCGLATALKAPSVGFDSDTLVLPAYQTERIIQWTDTMDAANGYELDPSGPPSTTIVQDTTVKGGGCYGTNAQTSGIIGGHVTPNTWQTLGVFQPFLESEVGDPIALSTTNGLLCGEIVETDVIPKKVWVNGEWVHPVDEKYRRAEPRPGYWYIMLCMRYENDLSTNATTELLILTVQNDQAQTNTGACW